MPCIIKDNIRVRFTWDYVQESHKKFDSIHYPYSIIFKRDGPKKVVFQLDMGDNLLGHQPYCEVAKLAHTIMQLTMYLA